ncbi:hypothetical protein DFH07DRAFT_973279 [Mycena maculata]|uniref:Uncharacterized protein n=1 Tax=Mycena maculata TaxID=230809 RepID=A0AAD7MI49_9AGAR|nr:hypothetical protein DFH07DRAFT_973279 [Mycena maculata]
MPRKGTAKRKRECLGLAPVKPGKRSWVFGSKLTFLESFEDEYRAAAEIKATGDFYSKIAQLFLKKFGYELNWDEDLDDGQDVADDIDPNEDIDNLDAEESTWRAQYYTEVRRKIGAWYNSKYGGAVSKKQKILTFKELFNKKELEPPAPVKPRILHYYSCKFYTERIKPRVVACWNAVSRTKPVPGVKAPQLVNVWNQVTREAWNSETEPFKKEVLASMEKEHEVAKQAYELAVSGEAPSTPEGYDVAINNAAYYLQPFADGIHNRFGMNVTIMMCGPVPDRGGRIEVRSVHSGMSNGMIPRIWSDFDRARFDNAQRSMVEFSQHCFTEAECRARSLVGRARESTAVDAAPVATQIPGGAPNTVSGGTPDTAPSVTPDGATPPNVMPNGAADADNVSFDADNVSFDAGVLAPVKR